MRNCSFLLLAFSCASLSWSQASTAPAPSAMPKVQGPEAVAASDPNKVVATVEGKPVTAKQALDLLKVLTPEERKQNEGKLSDVLQRLYTSKRLAEEASKLNLEQQDPWKDRLVMARQQVLAQAFITQEAAKSPEDPKAYYDSHSDEFEQVKLSGIFVTFTPPGTPAAPGQTTTKTEQQAEDKANEIEKKLKAGGDFAALARTDNDNTASAAQGGDLGTYNLGDPKLPPVLRSAITKLQAGQYSEPVRVNGAFLILKLNSRTKQPYADVQTNLTEKLKNEKAQNVVKAEIDKDKVKVEDQDFFAVPGSRPIPSLQRSPSAPVK